MKREVAPQETTRAEAFSLWMSSPMPMVTLTKTFNLTIAEKNELPRLTNSENNSISAEIIGGEGYVFNLADFAILAGVLTVLLRGRKTRK